jgi:hypothetical protein
LEPCYKEVAVVAGQYANIRRIEAESPENAYSLEVEAQESSVIADLLEAEPEEYLELADEQQVEQSAIGLEAKLEVKTQKCIDVAADDRSEEHRCPLQDVVTDIRCSFDSS